MACIKHECWQSIIKLSLESLILYLTLYAPLKKISKNKLNFTDKPWKTFGLQKCISIQNNYLWKFIRLKDPTKKEEDLTYVSYKYYKNLLSKLLK